MQVLRGPRALPVLLVVLLLSLTPVGAGAQSQQEVERTEAAKDEAYERLRSVNSRLEAALLEYHTINGELEDLTWRTTQLRSRVQDYEGEVRELRDRARDLVVEAYMSGRTDLIEVALESNSIQEVITRKLLLDRAADSDLVSIGRLDVIRREMERLKSELDIDLEKVAELRTQAEAVVVEMDALQKEAAAEFARAQAEAAEALKKFQEEERRRRLAEEARRKGGSDGVGGDVTPGFRCPVPGASFINDWGFPRSGGRKHQGTDMFAPRGAKVLAVGKGTVTLRSNTLGGRTVWLRADHGVSYYFAHLDGYAQGIGTGQRVDAGQLIGYVGTTGNAVGTSPHLHFEMHPGGGSAVNPYPTLVRSC